MHNTGLQRKAPQDSRRLCKWPGGHILQKCDQHIQTGEDNKTRKTYIFTLRLQLFELEYSITNCHGFVR